MASEHGLVRSLPLCMIVVALLTAACSKRKDAPTNTLPTAAQVCAHLSALRVAEHLPVDETLEPRCIAGLMRSDVAGRDVSWPAMMRATNSRQFACLGNTVTTKQVHDCMAQPAHPIAVTKGDGEAAGEGDEEEERGEPGEITLTHYQGLRNGMHYEEVVRALGAKGQTVQQIKTPRGSMRTVVWHNENDSTLTATFENDRLVSKSQMRLPNRR